MRDDICTIPISEVFEENDGCPICRMYETVEEHIVSYIMGAAMMEPDVRQVTNKTGFCEKHYRQMLSRRGRLQLALMLESHLDDINANVLSNKLFRSDKSKGDKAKGVTDSCFICDKIQWGMSRMLETLYKTYENEKDFREMFNRQEMFCMPHFELLMAGADKKKLHSTYGDFVKNLTRITQNYSASLHSDVKKYCSMYDYRNAGENADWGNSKDSVERAISFLIGTKIE